MKEASITIYKIKLGEVRDACLGQYNRRSQLLWTLHGGNLESSSVLPNQNLLDKPHTWSLEVCYCTLHLCEELQVNNHEEDKLNLELIQQQSCTGFSNPSFYSLAKAVADYHLECSCIEGA